MRPSSLAPLIADLQAKFTIEPADSPELIREAHRLRHQVFCVENRYLHDEDELEIDEYDAHSRQAVLQDRASGEVVGTVRLVFWRPDAPGSSFPMQQACPAPLQNYAPLATTAEVSRFALSKTRRDLVGANAVLLRLALLQGVVRLSAEGGATHWAAIMEPGLLRLLKASSIYFTPIGAPVEYHGLRQACYGDVDAVLSRVARENPVVWNLITEGGKLWSAPRELPLAA